MHDVPSEQPTALGEMPRNAMPVGVALLPSKLAGGSSPGADVGAGVRQERERGSLRVTRKYGTGAYTF